MSAGPAAAHRHGVRRSPAPRGPRRISGPSRTAEAREAARQQRAMTVAGGAVALPRPVGVPSLLPRAIDALRRLPDNRWLDRLLRGQTWIVVIGIALMGIVAMQVSLLKMNAGIGRAVEHAGTLERQNADLRAAVSTLSSEERIQREAAAMGLVMPPAGDVRYVNARGSLDARRAVKRMRPPNPPQTAQMAQAGAAVAPVAEAAATATPTAPDPAAQAAPPTQSVPEQQAAPPAETQVQPQQEAAPPAAAQTGAVAAPTGAPGQ